MNLKVAKIISGLIIISFFLPFFVVSCNEQSISFTGFETTFGKDIDGVADIEGSPFAIILIIPVAALLVMAFRVNKIKEETKQSFVFKNIFVIVPVFNIFAAITLRFAVRIILDRRIADYLGDSSLNFTANFNALSDAIILRASYGFFLYMLLNITLIVLAAVNYSKKAISIVNTKN
jgi:hypothetical protein